MSTTAPSPALDPTVVAPPTPPHSAFLPGSPELGLWQAMRMSRGPWSLLALDRAPVREA
jgi:hypothetical protein